MECVIQQLQPEPDLHGMFCEFLPVLIKTERHDILLA